MKKIGIVLALMLSIACSSHTQAIEVRYAGGLAAFGGGLLIAAPKFNGDGFGGGTTAAGAALVVLGAGLLIGSWKFDPGSCGVCAP